MNNKMKSIPLKSLLITSLNTQLTQLEKTSLTEMKQIKDFSLQIKSMQLTITTLHLKSSAMLALTKQSPNNNFKTKAKEKDKAIHTLKHNKSVKKLVRNNNCFDIKTKQEQKRHRAYTVKRKPIIKKNVDFEEIVKMHMIDFNRIEDDFSELKGSTTIQNDTPMNINISLIDNDIDYFTNDFDKNEEEVIKNLTTAKYTTHNPTKHR